MQFGAMQSIVGIATRIHVQAPSTEYLHITERLECDRKAMMELCECVGANVLFGKACPAMQSVAKGTSEELYRLVGVAYQSVGAA